MEKSIRYWEDNKDVNQSAEDKLAQIIETHIRLYVDNPYRGKVLMRDVYCLEGAHKEVLRKKEIKYVNYVRGVLAEIIDHEGSKVDINVATFSLFGMLNWIYQWYSLGGNISPEELAKNFIQIILTGLKRDEGRGSVKKRQKIGTRKETRG